MKVLSRDFTSREKIMLLILSIILLGVFYYIAIDQPVRKGIKEAEVNIESLEREEVAADEEIIHLKNMKNEINLMKEAGNTGLMESYNNSKNEVNFINKVMADADQYHFSFDDLTRNGDQIRRYISIQFIAKDYGTAKNILRTIEKCPYRILINSVNCSSVEKNGNISLGQVTVSLKATFFETMVDGEEDLALPKDADQQKEEDLNVEEYNY